MAELSPPSGTMIINTLMTSYVSATITSDLTSPTWTWTLTPIDGAPDDVVGVNFLITNVGAVTIAYVDKVRLYPIELLSYTKSNYESVTITSLSQLPEDPLESPFIHQYRVSDRSYLEWRLDVQVNGTETTTTDDTSGGGTGGTTTTTKKVTLNGTYIVRVRVDYNEHKNILGALLDERKNY